MLHRALAPSSGPPDTALFGPQVPLAQLANPLANGPRGGSRCPCHRCLPAPAYRPYLSSKEPPPHPLVHSGRKRPVPASDGIFIDHPLSIPSKLKIVKLICDDYLVNEVVAQIHRGSKISVVAPTPPLHVILEVQVRSWRKPMHSKYLVKLVKSWIWRTVTFELPRIMRN